MSQVRASTGWLFAHAQFLGSVLRAFLGSPQNWLDERRVDGRGMSWEMRWLKLGGSTVRILRDRDVGTKLVAGPWRSESRPHGKGSLEALGEGTNVTLRSLIVIRRFLERVH
jgi:hypothetical protein